MAPRSRRNNLLLPLALGATAAAASFALWYFLSDDEPPVRRSHREHESDSELARRRTPPSNVPKKSIALVVSESNTLSTLLAAIPSPLPIDRANVFILIFSPLIKVHPLLDTDDAAFEAKEAEGRVYRQARKLFPREAPRELVLPFTGQESLVPMLKHLAPETVYIEAALAGADASVVGAVMEGGWVGGVVVAVEDHETGQRLANETGRFGKRCRVLDVPEAGRDWMDRVGS